MGRIRKNINISGRECWTLFDNGSRNNYIVQDVAKNLPVFEFKKSQRVSLGGKVHSVTRYCLIDCIIERKSVTGYARVLNEVGMDEEGRRIEVIIGALTMQEWGIRLIPDEEKLDMSHYPEEFVEY